jgi:hypothetical protein
LNFLIKFSLIEQKNFLNCLLFQFLFRFASHLCNRKRNKEYKPINKEEYEEDCIFVREFVRDEFGCIGRQ